MTATAKASVGPGTGSGSSTPHGPRLGSLLVLCAVTMAVLSALSALLKVPSGFGIENFLGWTDSGALQGMDGLWQERLGTMKPWVFGAYFALDNGVFVPAYGLALLAIWAVVANAFLDHVGVYSDAVRQRAMGLGLTLLASLLLFDVLENSLALLVHGPRVAVLLSLVLLVLAVLWARGWLDRDWITQVWREFVPAARFAVLCAVSLVIVVALCAQHAGAASRMIRLLAAAHAGKQGLLLAWVAVIAAQGTWLLFGPHHKHVMWPRYVELRVALAAIPWRSLYVLIALSLCIALLLVMDQGRDVIYALAARPWAADAGPWALVQTAFALFMTGAALIVLSYTCWLWTRAGVKVARRPPEGKTLPVVAAQRLEDLWARDWARFLGIAPAILMLAMCLNCLPDAVSTSVAIERFGPVLLLLSFAVLVLAGAARFIWHLDQRGSAKMAYFNCQLLDQLLEEMGRARKTADSPYRVLWGWLGPRSAPLLALALAMLCRAVQLAAPPDWQMPSLSIALVLFEVSFWLSLAGWVSLYETSERVPWALLLIVWGGFIGGMGWSENHEAPSAALGVMAHPGTYLAVSAMLALALTRIYWLLSGLALATNDRAHADPKQKPSADRIRTWLQVLGLMLACVCLPPLASHFMGDAEHEAAPAASATKAGEAMTAWLQALCGKSNDDNRCEPGKPTPIYVIAAEGGGIRNAYWTALALARLHLADPGFDERTFAMSGVSGGAVGLAVYRACRIESGGHENEASHLVACIERFGGKDLLGSLVGAWFFEDVVARWLPLVNCNQPACGFLSRGLWFEQAMATTSQAFTDGLVAGREKLRDAIKGGGGSLPHVPYLLLNSTWVETGERVIASELLIDWHLFPGARDQLALLGHSDLPLVSAAHNSARFPFTNALASVHTPAGRCTRNAYLQRESGEAAQNSNDLIACGHMADGGYFDVAGTQGAFDVLHLLNRCLQDERGSDDEPGLSSDACPGIAKSRRMELAQALQPRLLLIRNGVQLERPGDPSCVDIGHAPPRDAVVLPKYVFNPAAVGRPVCAGNRSLFIDAFGPLITALNAIGTGSNGRLAAVRPRGEIFMPDHRPVPAGSERKDSMPADEPRVLTLDLVEDGPLFPLGWHLSATARTEMRRRACEQLQPKELLGVAAQEDMALCGSHDYATPPAARRDVTQ